MSDGTNGIPHLGNGGILTAMAPNDKGKMLPLEAAPDIQTFLQTNKVSSVYIYIAIMHDVQVIKVIKFLLYY